MSTLAIPHVRPKVVYPDSDGKPMAENTLQYRWIVTIVGGLRHLFASNPNVFVAGDLFWYPVVGHPEICTAPDAMVAFGRPQGDRGSYRQWEEGGIAPQVVFEVLSPSNRFGEMSSKFDFYSRHGVEEYYIYNPDVDHLELSGFIRHGAALVEIAKMHGHVSPRTGIRFDMAGDELRIIRPDGEAFVSFEELARREELERQLSREAKDRAERAEVRAKQAEDLTKQAEDRAKQADERAEQADQRAERLQRELNELRRRSDAPKTGNI